MIRRVAVAIALIALVVPLAAQQRDRASIPDEYKWDLTNIYPSNAAWRSRRSTKRALERPQAWNVGLRHHLSAAVCTFLSDC